MLRGRLGTVGTRSQTESTGAGVGLFFNDDSAVPEIVYFLQGRHLDGPHYSEPRKLGAGMEPAAFRQLRVHDLPDIPGSLPAGTAETFCLVVPRSAPHHPWVLRYRFVEGIGCGSTLRVDREGGIEVRTILIQHPLDHVAVHVVKPPGIRLLPPDRMSGCVAVSPKPGILSKELPPSSSSPRKP